MAKSVHNDVLDAALNEIATATRLSVCSAEPADFAGISAVSLASVTLAGGDYTNADGDTSGRKVTIAQQTGETVSSSGTATHIALDDGVTLLYVTTCTSQALTASNDLTVNAFDIEIADPT